MIQPYKLVDCFDRRDGVVVRESALWAEGRGSVPGHDRPKSLKKMVVLAFPLGAQE